MLQPIKMAESLETLYATATNPEVDSELRAFAQEELDRHAKLSKPYPLLEMARKVNGMNKQEVNQWLIDVTAEFGGRAVDGLIAGYQGRSTTFKKYALEAREFDLEEIIDTHRTRRSIKKYAMEILANGYFDIDDHKQEMSKFTTKHTTTRHLAVVLRHWADKHKQAFDLFG